MKNGNTKSKLLRTLILTLALSLLTASTAAAVETATGTITPISTGISNISSQINMVKSGLVYGHIPFVSADFDRALGLNKVKSITVTSLPEIYEGTLMLGSINVSEGQIISRANMNLLKFVPAQGGEYDSSFTFNAGSSHDTQCVLRMISAAHFAPTVTLGSAVSVWTQRDISSFGVMTATDPEDDKLTFEITNSPKKGMITVIDAHHGDFKYTPYADCTGSDRFTYVARDEYGNYSEEATVTVKIVKPEADIVFTDMDKDNDWAYNAALVMTARGIMPASQFNGEYTFSPSATVTRSEFLVMVMTALGADSIPTVAQTPFADDGEISAESKGYAASALRLGIIKGDVTQSGTFFHPNAPITRAEAAVILNNIIGAAVPTSAPAFADMTDIPVWAQNSLYALNDLGILKGTGSNTISPKSTLTKAQTAQIIFKMLEIVK